MVMVCSNNNMEQLTTTMEHTVRIAGLGVQNSDSELQESIHEERTIFC
jgi:hypothetical protein